MKYPTVAEINAADVDTILKWRRELPPPQTDVERTVHRRIAKRGQQSDEATAECLGKFGEILRKCQAVVDKAKGHDKV